MPRKTVPDHLRKRPYKARGPSSLKGRKCPERTRPEEDRFFEKIVKAEGHWLWVGAHKPSGYGMFWFREDENFIAHRASYIMHVGEIPDHLVVDHRCRVKSCVNPEHLRLIPQAENCTIYSNSPQGINKRKTECKRGHAFTPDNIMWSKLGHRNCIACYKMRLRGEI